MSPSLRASHVFPEPPLPKIRVRRRSEEDIEFKCVPFLYLSQQFHYFGDHRPLDRGRLCTFAKLSPDKERQFSTIRWRFRRSFCETSKQTISLVLPKQFLHPIIDRDHMEMDRIAWRMAVAADIHPLSMQFLLQGFLSCCQQWPKLGKRASDNSDRSLVSILELTIR